MLSFLIHRKTGMIGMINIELMMETMMAQMVPTRMMVWI